MNLIQLVVIVSILIVQSAVVAWITWRINRDSPTTTPDITVRPTPVNINLESLEHRISDVPGKVLQSIQASNSTHKGALGELIGYLQLRAEYDRIIPVGNIVDFICIKFSTDTDKGYIDFVDIKAGPHASLSKDQRSLKSLIAEKNVNFVKVTIADDK